jgi:hypothetical protein
LTSERLRMHRTQVLTAFLAFLFLGAGTAASAAEEMIDDPGYTYWSQFKPGSFSVVATDSDAAGQKMTMQMTTTLIAVTAEKVTVEVKTEISAGGTKQAPRTSKREVPARRVKPPKTSIKESAAEVVVGAKTYACVLMEETRDTMKIKTWMSKQVPGGLLKAEMDDEGLSLKSHLLDFSAK